MNAPHTDAVDVLRKNSRSFSIASRFLPQRVRFKVQQLYAWCRSVDDAVDHAETHQAAQYELDRIAEDLRRIESADFAGVDTLDHPASKWIAPLILHDGVDVSHAADLIEGMQIDLQMDRGNASIDQDPELLRYCYHAAGTVGLMMTQIMGVRDPAAHPHAIALGVAMQLTNIARDVREDAERGRCYLPGINCVDNSNEPAIRDAVRRTLALAECRYKIAESGLRYLPADCRRAIRVALAAYREIGREILRRDCHVLSDRTIVPKIRLFSVVAQAAFAGVFSMSQTSNQPVVNTPASITNTPEPTSSILQCKSAVWLGLSLTAFMATALFMMVYMNPKSDAYNFLPLVYATTSLVFGIIANRLSVRFETQNQRLQEL